MEVTEELKEMLEVRNYERLLRDWRFCVIGDPMFQGDSGKLYTEVMDRKRKQLSVNEAVAISKKVGWE